MPIKLDNPLPTKLFRSWDLFLPKANSIFLYGTSVESRSIHPEEWENKIKDVKFVRVWSDEENDKNIPSNCRIQLGDMNEILKLRGEKNITDCINRLGGEGIYLDITGLSHGIWAPLLKSAIMTKKRVDVVYAEPRSYSFSKTPTEAEIFDLSTQIRDIAPIPGFSSLSEPSGEDSVVFVPLLGFEGRRLAYIFEKVQPPNNLTIPIIGVPGFRMEYPFYTYLGNRNILSISKINIRVRYAVANSASDVFYQLNEISENYPNHLMKVAPIGTKPHALGAILFALNSKKPVELIYDHPIRKQKELRGVEISWFIM